MFHYLSTFTTITITIDISSGQGQENTSTSFTNLTQNQQNGIHLILSSDKIIFYEICKVFGFIQSQLRQQKESRTIIRFQTYICLTLSKLQLSSTDTLGPRLEQHTQITWKAQLKCAMHYKVGRYRWGMHYRFFQHTYVLTRPPTYKKIPKIFL